MTLTDVLAVVAACFGIGMGASPLLQAIRVRRRRRSDDVSLPFLIVLWFGGIAWLSYGVALGNLALIVANSVGVGSSSLAIGVVLRWRFRAERPTVEPEGDWSLDRTKRAPLCHVMSLGATRGLGASGHGGAFLRGPGTGPAPVVSSTDLTSAADWRPTERVLNASHVADPRQPAPPSSCLTLAAALDSGQPTGIPPAPRDRQLAKADGCSVTSAPRAAHVDPDGCGTMPVL